MPRKNPEEAVPIGQLPPPPESLRISERYLLGNPDALIHEFKPSGHRLWGVTAPVVIENLLALAVAWSDTILTRLFYGTNANLASITVGTQIFFLVTAIAGIVSVGAAGLVSRRIGAGRPAKANEVTQQALIMAFLLGCFLALFLLLYAPWIVRAFRLSPEARPIATTYLRILALSFPFIMLQHSATACLRSSGSTWAAARITFIGNMLTIGLSWLFAGLWPSLLGVGWLGIPIGTSVGYSISATVAVMWLMVGTGMLRLPPGELPIPDPRRIGQILYSGVPGGMIWILINIGALWQMTLVGTLGDAALAAHGAALRCEALCWLAARSLAIAAGSLVGQGLGAERSDLASGYGWLSLRWGVIASTILGLLMWLISPWLTLLFLKTDNAQAMGLVLSVMPWVTFSQPPLAITLILMTALISGAGQTSWSLIISFFFGIVLRVILTALLINEPLSLGLHGVWIANLADYVCRAAMFVWVFRSIDWRYYRR